MRVGVWKNVSKGVIAQQEMGAGKHGWPEPTSGPFVLLQPPGQSVDISCTVREMRIGQVDSVSSVRQNYSTLFLLTYPFEAIAPLFYLLPAQVDFLQAPDFLALFSI